MGSGVAQRKEGLRDEVGSLAGEGVRVCAYTQCFLVVNWTITSASVCWIFKDTSSDNLLKVRKEKAP